jgi:hypothetical protein
VAAQLVASQEGLSSMKLVIVRVLTHGCFHLNVQRILASSINEVRIVKCVWAITGP